MPATEFHTAAMVRELIREDRAWSRYETVRGELLVTPAPRMLHQRIAIRLLRALGTYLDRWPIGEVLAAPADISWRPDTLVQPDVFVVPLEQSRTLDWTRVRTLLLAAEILSPSSVRADRFTKRRLYQDAGVPVYWIIDADAGSVEIWTPDAALASVERDALRWHPAGAAEPFTLSLTTLFQAL